MQSKRLSQRTKWETFEQAQESTTVSKPKTQASCQGEECSGQSSEECETGVACSRQPQGFQAEIRSNRRGRG